MDLVHPAIRSAVEIVLRDTLPKPVLGFELMVSGVIVATAEAAWPSLLVAIIRDDMAYEIEAFQHAGWTVAAFGSAGIAANALDTLMSHLRSQT